MKEVAESIYLAFFKTTEVYDLHYFLSHTLLPMLSDTKLKPTK